MNTITQLWEDTVAYLHEQRNVLGIVASVRAEAGQQSLTKVPGCMTWIEAEGAAIEHVGKAYAITVSIFVFCVSGGHKTSAESLDEAMTIALKVAALLSGQHIAGAYVEADPTKLIEVIDAKANVAVCSVNLKAEVRLE